MGVRTLTSFVHDNGQRLFERFMLKDCIVIIDGYGMCHHFIEASQIPWRLGGDYTSFHYILTDFFTKLNQCGIQAIFVFDGPCEDDKEATRLRRMQEKVNRIAYRNSQRNQTFMPVLIKEVFLLVAQDPTLNVQCFNAFGDVDKITLALANQLNAPIVTNDSDFFVLDVNAGCIPCRHFSWNSPELFEGQMCLPVYLYSRPKLLSMFNLKPHLIQYIAIILGCDWIDSLPALTKWLNEDKSKRRSKVSIALTWLSSYNDKSVDDLETRIISFADKNSRKSYALQLKKCLQQYEKDDSPINFTSINNSLTDISVTSSICIKQEHVKIATVLDKVNEVRPGVNYPNYHKILKMVTNRELPAFCIPLFRSAGRIFLLSTHFSHVSLPSPNTCALQLRMLSYKILLECEDLRDYASVFAEGSEGDWFQVKEYDRYGLQVEGRVSDVRNLECQCDIFDTRRVLDWIFHPDYHSNLDCQDLMTHTLLGCGSIIQYMNIKERLEANNVPLHYILVLLTSFYWKRFTYVRQQQSFFVKATCLAAISSQFEETKQFGKGQNCMKHVNYKVRHRIQEWQSCMKAVIQLNRLLGYPCPHPVIMFNCNQLAYYFQSMCSGLFDFEMDLPIDVRNLYYCIEDIIIWISHNYGYSQRTFENRYGF